MEAIQVRYLPATDTKPTRIKAWSYSGKSVTLATTGDNQTVMARAVVDLLVKLGWQGSWVGGLLPNQDYAFVCVKRDGDITVGI